MSVPPYIFLAGASRGVGLEIARCLTQLGQPVRAMLRSEAARPELEGIGSAGGFGRCARPRGGRRRDGSPQPGGD